MRKVMGIVLMAMAVFAGFKFYEYTQRYIAEHEKKPDAPTQWAPGKIPGLPARLEDSLTEAKQQGPNGLRRWLARHRLEVEDPRLAEIDLDYVVLIGRSEPKEARRILNAIGQRIQSESPVYDRYEQLNRVYQE